MNDENWEIKAAIYIYNLKQRDIAKRLGISESSFSELLKHKLPDNKKTEILSIIKTLGTQESE